jgi:hypothetical protein
MRESADLGLAHAEFRYGFHHQLAPSRHAHGMAGRHPWPDPRTRTS